MNVAGREINYEKCPERFRGGLQRYLEYRIPPGSFLLALLENNLTETFNRADDDSLRQIQDVLQFVYSEVPRLCWGSVENVNAWMAPRWALEITPGVYYQSPRITTECFEDAHTWPHEDQVEVTMALLRTKGAYPTLRAVRA